MARARDGHRGDTTDDLDHDGDFVVLVPRRPRVRHYKRCRCRKSLSPIVDTFHTAFMRWSLTALAVLAFVAQMAWPALGLTVIAVVAWKHR